jgi:hypothetical protein
MCLGGKLEGFYMSFGEHDWVPLRVTTSPLSSVEETDMALQKRPNFQPPGQFTGR